jgi:hypothetical protein
MDNDSGAISSLDKDDVLDPKSIAQRSVGVSNSRPTCFVSSATCAPLLLDCSNEAKNLNSNDRVSKKQKKEAVEDGAFEDQLQHIEEDATTKKAIKRTKWELLLDAASSLPLAKTSLKSSSISDNQERAEMLNSWDAILATLVQSANDKFIPDLQHLYVEKVATEFMAKNMLDKQEDLMQSGVSGHIGKFMIYSYYLHAFGIA